MNPTPWQRAVVAALAGLLAFTVSVSAQAVFEQITYYHNDVIGSPIAATNSSGNVVWKEGYAPYGQRLKIQDGGSNEIWFHGKPSDSETGLSYFGARYYDPAIGRFMAMDPKGYDERNVHSVNRYAYGNNNPYRFIDTDGAAPTELDEMATSARGAGAKFEAERARNLYYDLQNNRAPLNGKAGEPGEFARAPESMSPRAVSYQAKITGTAPNTSYIVKGVKFDGYTNGALLDAKGSGYATFVRNGQFESFFQGADRLAQQAQRQLAVANGTPIQWHFAEEAAASATRTLFQQRGITGIEIFHTPE